MCCTALLLVTPRVLLMGCIKTAVVRLDMRCGNRRRGKPVDAPGPTGLVAASVLQPCENCRCQRSCLGQYCATQGSALLITCHYEPLNIRLHEDNESTL